MTALSHFIYYYAECCYAECVATQMEINNKKTLAYISFSIARVKVVKGLAPDFIYDE
jgi:hypothetical protein